MKPIKLYDYLEKITQESKEEVRIYNEGVEFTKEMYHLIDIMQKDILKRFLAVREYLDDNRLH